jgi:hypothetical protein
MPNIYESTAPVKGHWLESEASSAVRLSSFARLDPAFHIQSGLAGNIYAPSKGMINLQQGGPFNSRFSGEPC